VLGAVAHATERIELMTYVTCPTMRYHPAVVAQKAATVQLLSDGRFTLGLGAGENLNEHVARRAWPPVDLRHEMLDEALEIIRALFDGDTVTFRGEHLETENAKLWDLPPEPPKIGVAVSGPEGCELAGRHADAMIAVQPERELGDQFDAAGGAGKPRIGQVGVSYDADQTAAVKRALHQFRWFASGWKVNAELPSPASFAAASQAVREDDITEQIPCGPDVATHVEGVKAFVDAGFTHVAVVQIGGDSQDIFFDWAADELLPALRRLD
jgi:G6PDH family F420-dependent oxidoreductase